MTDENAFSKEQLTAWLNHYFLEHKVIQRFVISVPDQGTTPKYVITNVRGSRITSTTDFKPPEFYLDVECNTLVTELDCKNAIDALVSPLQNIGSGFLTHRGVFFAKFSDEKDYIFSICSLLTALTTKTSWAK